MKPIHKSLLPALVGLCLTVSLHAHPGHGASLGHRHENASFLVLYGPMLGIVAAALVAAGLVYYVTKSVPVSSSDRETVRSH